MPTCLRALLALLCLAVACTPGGTAQPRPSASAVPAAGPIPSALATPGAQAAIPDESRLEPLTALGKCPAAPDARGTQSVEGLVVPDEAVLTSVTETDPLVNVQGYVPMTPVQVRVFYQQHPDLEVLSVEDEVFEAEVLVEGSGHRVFVKAQATCELGSVFVAVVAPQVAPDS